MDFPSRCVTDANIWIDFHAGGALDRLFSLPIEWLAPDAVIQEQLGNPHGTYLLARGLRSVELTPEQVATVVALRALYRRPSIPDLFALVVARDLNALLLTGDKNLREAAEQEGVAVHGTLWLLDQMVDLAVFSPGDACDVLERMLSAGRRLPLDECRQRLRGWKR